MPRALSVVALLSAFACGSPPAPATPPPAAPSDADASTSQAPPPDADAGVAARPPELIQRVVRDNYGSIKKCYEAGLARDPKLTGTVRTRFIVAPDGSVSDVGEAGNTTLPDADVVACVRRAYAEIKFPPGGKTTVVHPIVLKPAD